MRHSDMDITSQIARYSEEIIQCMASCADPVEIIMNRYASAKDKDIFVAALAGTLLLRHRQWQAGLMPRETA